jgi:hypothetical protein
MSNQRESEPAPSQSDKFRNAARELGCDEDEARWDERLRKVARQKPAEPKEDAKG